MKTRAERCDGVSQPAGHWTPRLSRQNTGAKIFLDTRDTKQLQIPAEESISILPTSNETRTAISRGTDIRLPKRPDSPRLLLSSCEAAHAENPDVDACLDGGLMDLSHET